MLHRGSGDGAPEFPLSEAEWWRWSHEIVAPCGSAEFLLPLDRLALTRAQEAAARANAAVMEAGGARERREAAARAEAGGAGGRRDATDLAEAGGSAGGGREGSGAGGGREGGGASGGRGRTRRREEGEGAGDWIRRRGGKKEGEKKEK